MTDKTETKKLKRTAVYIEEYASLLEWVNKYKETTQALQGIALTSKQAFGAFLKAATEALAKVEDDGAGEK